MSEAEDKRRIEKLEGEVARLKAKAGEDEPEVEATPAPGDLAPGDLAPGGEVQLGRPVSRPKVVAVAVAVVIVGLVILVALFTALSRVFDDAAHEAAKSLTLEDEQHDPAAGKKPEKPQPKRPPPEIPPGL